MVSRRQFTIRASQGAVLIPLLTIVNGPVHAAERITAGHPTAAALGYVHVAAETDVTKYPKRAGAEGAKQFCDNCSQYQATEDAWGTCGIFPNYLVAAKGWCNVWVPIT